MSHSPISHLLSIHCHIKVSMPERNLKKHKMLQLQVPVLQTVQQEQRSVTGQQDYVSGIISGQVMEKLKDEKK